MPPRAHETYPEVLEVFVGSISKKVFACLKFELFLRVLPREGDRLTSTQKPKSSLTLCLNGDTTVRYGRWGRFREAGVAALQPAGRATYSSHASSTILFSALTRARYTTPLPKGGSVQK